MKNYIKVTNNTYNVDPGQQWSSGQNKLLQVHSYSTDANCSNKPKIPLFSRNDSEKIFMSSVCLQSAFLIIFAFLETRKSIYLI